MNTSTENSEPRATEVRFVGAEMVVRLADGRTLFVPLNWFPRLFSAQPRQRERYELIGNGVDIHWPMLDEDLSVEGLLRGTPSIEAAAPQHAR